MQDAPFPPPPEFAGAEDPPLPKGYLPEFPPGPYDVFEGEAVGLAISFEAEVPPFDG